MIDKFLAKMIGILYNASEFLSGKGSSMQAFLEYIEQVENLVHTLLSTSSLTPYNSQIDSTLNGGPSKELRKSFDIQILRETGIFFTSKDLAQTLLVEEKAALLQPGKLGSSGLAVENVCSLASF